MQYFEAAGNDLFISTQQTSIPDSSRLQNHMYVEKDVCVCLGEEEEDLPLWS